MKYIYHEPIFSRVLNHSDIGLTKKNSEYLMHYSKNKESSNHKYVSREWKNGQWVYTYPEDTPINKRENKGQAINDKNSDEYRLQRLEYNLKVNNAKQKKAKEDYEYFNKQKDKWNNQIDTIIQYFEKEADHTYRMTGRTPGIDRKYLDRARELKNQLKDLKPDDYIDFLYEIHSLQNTVNTMQYHK